MQVTCATNGEAAVQCVSAGNFDIVLMDVSMPVMNGHDATRAIRALASPARRGRFAELPIIGVTASAMSGDRERCLASGMTDYVTKPIQRDRLLEKIAGALAHRRPAPEPCLA